MDLLAVGIVALLLSLNAIFVAAEFAIVGASRAAVERLAATGTARAAMTVKTLRDPKRRDRYIATAQLGITVASLGLGMYAEPRIAASIAERLALAGAPGWLASHALAGAVALLVLTYLHIVLGEMIPKALALTGPERAALWLSPLMLAAQTLAFPAVFLLDALGLVVLRAIGIRTRFAPTQLQTARELQHIVREAERGGLLRPESAAVVDELIEFANLNAWESMVPRVKIFGVEVGATLGELTELVSRAPHARYPVYAHDMDHIVGMVHIRDIARSVRERSGLRQSDIRTIPFVPGSATLDAVLAAMLATRAQMAVIMDEHGGTDGILTTEDLFEEIVGDIVDPTSDALPALSAADDGSLHVAGTVRIDEVGEWLGRNLEHEDVDTVSGLVLALLERPPSVGDIVSYDGLELEVLAVVGHGVAACRVIETRAAP